METVTTPFWVNGNRVNECDKIFSFTTLKSDKSETQIQFVHAYDKNAKYKFYYLGTLTYEDNGLIVHQERQILGGNYKDALAKFMYEVNKMLLSAEEISL